MKQLLGLLLSFSLLLIGSTPNAAETLMPVPNHVGSETCSGCHGAASKAWKNSHHAWAWNEPDQLSVLGDFADKIFKHKGVISRFTSSGGKFFVTTTGADGRGKMFEVVGTVGVTPLQQYLVETEPGRLQVLDIAWNTVKRRWYHLYPDQNLTPSKGLHWTGPYKNWNARCAECHATGYEKRYDPLNGRYSSTLAETGVGCEACHGPGSAHVAWARDRKGFDADKWRGVSVVGFTIGFDRTSSKPQLELCAGCHSRREPLGDKSPMPGTPFHDSYRLANLRNGLYHADGQIKDEVYVYGSFLQSKMYDRGVRCTDCHNPHSGALKAKGNDVCTRCHNPSGNPGFASLKKTEYDSPKHHFHEAGSDGAQCVSCHMLERTYMETDGRRDHSFRVPRPDVSAELGTPNACSDCHTDKSPGWAAVQLANRFPISTHRGAHYATDFAAARAGKGGSATATSLLDIALSNDYSSIVRATALNLLQRYLTPGIADRTAELLRDPDPLIRAAAVPLQRAAPLATRVRRVEPLLADKRKAVRIAAARAILDLLAARVAPSLAKSARRAVGEYRTSLTAKADFPEIQIAIAGTALVFRNYRVADRAFSEAVQMDPQRADAWVMIARLRAAQGDVKGTLDALRNGLAANPENPILKKMLDKHHRSKSKK